MIRRVSAVVTQSVLVVWTLFAIVPFVLVALLSLRNNQDIYAHPLGLGGSYHFSNYVDAWRGPSGLSTEAGFAGMQTYFLNTILATITALAVNLGTGSLAAYFATQFTDRGRSWFLRLFLIGTVVPLVLLLVPYYRAYSSFGLLSNPVALGVGYGVLGLPTTVLILFSHFVDFPRELVEAARIDGLGEVRTFLRIVLPLSKGALASVAMLLVVWAWNEAQLGVVLLREASSQTVTVGLLGFQGTFVTELGPIFAGLTLASIPVIALYLVFSRSLTRGIALGGVFR